MLVDRKTELVVDCGQNLGEVIEALEALKTQVDGSSRVHITVSPLAGHFYRVSVRL